MFGKGGSGAASMWKACGSEMKGSGSGKEANISDEYIRRGCWSRVRGRGGLSDESLREVGRSRNPAPKRGSRSQ